MPLEAAAGGLTLSQEALRYSLADCARFRTFAGAADQAAALARIHHDALPPPGSSADTYTLAEWATYRPFAVIERDRRAGYRRKQAAEYGEVESGKLFIHLEQAIAAGDLNDPAQIVRKFDNHVGVIIDELYAKSALGASGGVSYLQINDIRYVGPFRSSEEDAPGQGEYVFGLLEILWGQEG